MGQSRAQSLQFHLWGARFTAMAIHAIGIFFFAVVFPLWHTECKFWPLAVYWPQLLVGHLGVIEFWGEKGFFQLIRPARFVGNYRPYCKAHAGKQTIQRFSVPTVSLSPLNKWPLNRSCPTGRRGWHEFRCICEESKMKQIKWWHNQRNQTLDSLDTELWLRCSANTSGQQGRKENLSTWHPIAPALAFLF